MPIIVSIITYTCWRIWACVHKKHWKKEEPSEPSRKRKRSQQHVKEEEEEKKEEGGGVEMISTEKSKTKQTRHKRVPSPWENLSLEEQENRLKSEEAAVKEDGTKIPKEIHGWMRVDRPKTTKDIGGEPDYYFYQPTTGVTTWTAPKCWQTIMKTESDKKKTSLRSSLFENASSSARLRSSDLVAKNKKSLLIRRNTVNPLSLRRPTPKDHFVVCLVILMHLMYPTACQNTFRLLACTQVGNGPKDWFLQADLEQPCWQGSHFIMVVAVCIPQILLYVIGFPLASGLMLFKNRHRLHNARTKYRWGMLYVGLKKSRYYWEIVVSARKAAIFSLSVIGSANTGLAVQTHLAMFVLMSSLIAHLIGRPYMKGWELLDNFEVSGLVVCFCMMFSGIVFYTETAPEWLRQFATVLLSIMNFCYTFLTVTVLIRQKGVEDSPLISSMRRYCFGCCSDRQLEQFTKHIPAIRDPGQNWMGESGNSEHFNFQQENPHFQHHSRLPKLKSSLQVSEQQLSMPKVGKDILCSLEMANMGNHSSEEVTPLPPGWAKYISHDGHPYYFHAEKGESLWNPPTE